MNDLREEISNLISNVANEEIKNGNFQMKDFVSLVRFGAHLLDEFTSFLLEKNNAYRAKENEVKNG